MLHVSSVENIKAACVVKFIIYFKFNLENISRHTRKLNYSQKSRI